jgi:4-amino-4-deoxy-L-arabinose transferase-like glycosyltransferase
MFAFRFQVIVAVFVMGLFIYFFSKKHTNHFVAFFTALAYMTNGRLLIYESLFGLIDPTFALAVYAGMMMIFFFGEKKKYYSLFIFSYVACAMAFMLKGVPAIAFQGITLLTYFVLKRDFKRLFSAAHFIGAGVFIVLTGAYYIVYFSSNNLPPSVLFKNLFHESAQRTFIEYGFSATLKHIATFPVEILYHFLPWTIFLIACIQRKFRSIIQQNKFIQYSFWVFVTNIPIYWFSVDVYPKYIFMLIPLLYSIGFYFYFSLPENAWQKKTINGIIISSCVIFAAGSLSLPFLNALKKIDYLYLKAALFIAGFVVCAYAAVKTKYKVWAFLFALVIARFGFNSLALVQRGSRFFQLKNSAEQIVYITRGKPLYILGSSETKGTDGLSFYLETSRNEIIKTENEAKPGTYYIVDSNQLTQEPFTVDLKFLNPPFELYLVHKEN